jgi:hypothetical protein
MYFVFSKSFFKTFVAPAASDHAASAVGRRRIVSRAVSDTSLASRSLSRRSMDAGPTPFLARAPALQTQRSRLVLSLFSTSHRVTLREDRQTPLRLPLYRLRDVQ